MGFYLCFRFLYYKCLFIYCLIYIVIIFLLDNMYFFVNFFENRVIRNGKSSGSYFSLGDIIVGYFVWDISGNMVRCIFVIIVIG